MKFKLNIVAAALVTLPLSFEALSLTAEPITAAFKTIKDVTIVQVAGQEMVINGLQMASGATCTVAQPAIGVNWPGDTLMLASSTGTLAEAASYGATTGATCSTGTSIPGIYEIEGSAGSDVDVTLELLASGSGINFAPAGCAVDYNDAPDGELCTAIAAGATQTITLATTNDETVSAGNGQPEAGKSRLAVGGTITSTIGLSAASDYALSYDITVTY